MYLLVDLAEAGVAGVHAAVEALSAVEGEDDEDGEGVLSAVANVDVHVGEMGDGEEATHGEAAVAGVGLEGPRGGGACLLDGLVIDGDGVEGSLMALHQRRPRPLCELHQIHGVDGERALRLPPSGGLDEGDHGGHVVGAVDAHHHAQLRRRVVPLQRHPAAPPLSPRPPHDRRHHQRDEDNGANDQQQHHQSGVLIDHLLLPGEDGAEDVEVALDVEEEAEGEGLWEAEAVAEGGDERAEDLAGGGDGEEGGEHGEGGGPGPAGVVAGEADGDAAPGAEVGVEADGAEVEGESHGGEVEVEVPDEGGGEPAFSRQEKSHHEGGGGEIEEEAAEEEAEPPDEEQRQAQVESLHPPPLGVPLVDPPHERRRQLEDQARLNGEPDGGEQSPSHRPLEFPGGHRQVHFLLVLYAAAVGGGGEGAEEEGGDHVVLDAGVDREPPDVRLADLELGGEAGQDAGGGVGQQQRHDEGGGPALEPNHGEQLPVEEWVEQGEEEDDPHGGAGVGDDGIAPRPAEDLAGVHLQPGGEHVGRYGYLGEDLKTAPLRAVDGRPQDIQVPHDQAHLRRRG